ncbi:MAG: tRNA (adenosine(37)-N6)-threonylcarbamoyltransferase complex transferase subunit TsaD [Myxococcota bacterium]
MNAESYMNKALHVLGIESSCDETAASVVRTDGVVLSNVVASQVAIHGAFGGVVPEVASRAHLRVITSVVDQAVVEAGGWSEIDALAVTQGPGLIGGLLVGLQVAKAIGYCRNLPLVGVDHLEGHVMSVYLREGQQTPSGPEPPFVALLASGGHTSLYRVTGDSMEVVGQTRDDAAGEAYDKVAKLLHLGYPGGPKIDRLAADGDPNAHDFPKPMLHHPNCDFSFSGLKTAVALHVKEHGVPQGTEEIADICASFQQSVIEVLTAKSVRACTELEISTLVLTGGVAANRGLRSHAAQVAQQHGISLSVPPPKYCTDNAAMIAFAGGIRLAVGARDGFDIGAYSRDSARRRGKFLHDGNLVSR